MSVVGVDTQILFWGLVGKPPVGNEHLVPAAQQFMSWLDKQGHRVVVPSIVLGELLVSLSDEDAVHYATLVEANYEIVDYNGVAAVKFARIRHQFIREKRPRDLNVLATGVTRRELSADMMIVATCMVHGVGLLYSYDAPLRAAAEGWLPTQNFLEVKTE